jgi:Protein of unknown function (DUF2652)
LFALLNLGALVKDDQEFIMQKATILIPDISGYTQFLTKTELSHSTHIINELLQVLADTLENKFTLAEIEGDALLTYAKGRVSFEEIEAICKAAFLNFHYYLKVIERDNVCRCGACQQQAELSLKFIVHYGTFDEIKISNFTKLSGPDMIIAHRLMKNNVPTSEYILMTDDYFNNEVTTTSLFEWKPGHDLYMVLGDINYHYARLEKLRIEIKNPEKLEDFSSLFTVAQNLELEINAPLDLVHRILTDQSEKVNFVTGLKNLEYDSSINRIGSTHVCEFDEDKVDIRTLQEINNSDDVVYIEKATSLNTGFVMLTYYELKRLKKDVTSISFRALTGDRKPIPAPFSVQIYEQSKSGLSAMKGYIESLFLTAGKAS